MIFVHIQSPQASTQPALRAFGEGGEGKRRSQSKLLNPYPLCDREKSIALLKDRIEKETHLFFSSKGNPPSVIIEAYFNKS